jgi:hypothetical protein
LKSRGWLAWDTLAVVIEMLSIGKKDFGQLDRSDIHEKKGKGRTAEPKKNFDPRVTR